MVYTLKWSDGSGKGHAGNFLVHDITGGNDEFWWDSKDHYQDGWAFESPLPVHYEYRAFKCQ